MTLVNADDHVRLLESLERAQLLALHRVASMVTSSLDLSKTLPAIVDAARELAGAENSALLLLDGDHLEFRLGRGSSARLVGARLPVDVGVSGRALRDGIPVLMHDLWAEKDRVRPEFSQRTGVRALIIAPLIRRGERLGVVSVGSKKPGVFDQSNATIVGELAVLAASALVHAREFAEEQQLRAETQDANQHRQIGNDDVQRRVHLVRQAVDELADRGELLVVDQLLLHALQLFGLLGKPAVSSPSAQKDKGHSGQ